jgi:hypothetical protein
MSALTPRINTAVRAFRTDTSAASASPSKATLRAGYVWYTLAPLARSEEQGQMQAPSPANSATSDDVLAFREFLHPDTGWQMMRFLSEGN